MCDTISFAILWIYEEKYVIMYMTFQISLRVYVNKKVEDNTDLEDLLLQRPLKTWKFQV